MKPPGVMQEVHAKASVGSLGTASLELRDHEPERKVWELLRLVVGRGNNALERKSDNIPSSSIQHIGSESD